MPRMQELADRGAHGPRDRAGLRGDEVPDHLGQLGILHRHVHGGANQAGLVAAVETRAFETIGQDLALFFQQSLDRIGQLDLAACAGRGLLQQFEDTAGQDIASDDGQVRRRIGRLGLLDHMTDPGTAIVDRRRVDDAVLVGLVVRHFLHRDYACLLAGGQVSHLPQRAAAAMPDQIVRKDDTERLVADDRTRAEHCVSQSKCFGLGYEDRADVRGQRALDQRQQFVLALLFQLRLELVGLVEIVSDGVLVAVGDENERVRASFDGLVDRVLDQRAIEDRKHLLGNHLGRREESRAQSGDRENHLA